MRMTSMIMDVTTTSRCLYPCSEVHLRCGNTEPNVNILIPEKPFQNARFTRCKNKKI
jgi:hypothetical protein